MKSIFSLLSLAAVLLVAGCESQPDVVQVKYPVTYQVQIGNTQAVSDYGPQNTKTETTQQVTAEPGRPLYFHVDSSFEVLVTIFESPSPETRHEVSRVGGSTFTASVTPQTSMLDVVFSAAKPNTGGTLKFTVSDQPIPSD